MEIQLLTVADEMVVTPIPGWLKIQNIWYDCIGDKDILQTLWTIAQWENCFCVGNIVSLLLFSQTFSHLGSTKLCMSVTTDTWSWQHINNVWFKTNIFGINSSILSESWFPKQSALKLDIMQSYQEHILWEGYFFTIVKCMLLLWLGLIQFIFNYLIEDILRITLS